MNMLCLLVSCVVVLMKFGVMLWLVRCRWLLGSIDIG